MRNKILNIVGLLIFVCGVAQAGGSYSIALAGMGMHYTETDMQGNFADSEKSKSLLGFEANYAIDLNCNSIGCPTLQAAFSAYSGETDYEGSYFESGEPITSTTFNILYDLDFGVIQKTDGSFLDLHYGLGIGYHAWYRELSSTQNELYYWWYIAPELGISKTFGENFSIGLSMKYKYALLAEMLANDLDEPFTLGDTGTIELTLPLKYQLTKKVALFSEWTYAKQKIGRSDFQNGTIGGKYYEGIYEPDSVDYQNYLKLGVTISY